MFNQAMTCPGSISRLLLSLFAVAAAGLPASAGAAGLDERDSEPVVLTGAETPALLGAEPEEVVAFAWTGQRWRQVPVQVDERKLVDLRIARQSGREFRAMAYADPDTWVEADGVPQTEIANPRGQGEPVPGTAGDPTLDEDDEIALMAFDAGESATGRPAPKGVDPATRTLIRVTDPLEPGTHRFVYLFRTLTGQDPSAGSDYVSYEQVYSPALTGGYRIGYDYNGIANDANGPPANPEASVVTTSRYEIGIPARWMVDRLVIAAGEGETDILDGDKSTVGVSSCGRNELTFSRGGGGFLANIDGPVRAIRSFIGANSGTFTQREYVFYEGLWENRTFLRVHPGINTFVSAMDLSAGAIGMTYRNSNNQAGVPVDGVPDAVAPGPIAWDQFSGPQGSVTNVTRLTTDIDGTVQSSFYQDMADPPASSSMLCSGDDHSYGAAGPMVSTPQNNTDPTIADNYPNLPLSSFFSRRLTWFDGPEAGAELAATRSGQTDNPIVTQSVSLKPKLALRVKPARFTIRRKGKRRVAVTVTNAGEATARQVKICLRRSPAVRPVRCQTIGQVPVGRSVTRRFGIRPKRKTRPGKRLLWFKATAPEVRKTGAGTTLKLKR